MTTVSSAVENAVRRRPFIEDAVARGIINYTALAESMRREIDAETGSRATNSSIVMALRRLSEKRNFAAKVPANFRESDITMKSGLFELTILRSPTAVAGIRKIYEIPDFERGDFLTITHGIHEITIICSRKYRGRMQKILEKEKVVKIIDGLSSLTLNIPLRAVETAGIIYSATKALNWDDINIVEVVSTLTELTFILKESDAPRAFNTVKALIKE